MKLDPCFIGLTKTNSPTKNLEKFKSFKIFQIFNKLRSSDTSYSSVNMPKDHHRSTCLDRCKDYGL